MKENYNSNQEVWNSVRRKSFLFLYLSFVLFISSVFLLIYKKDIENAINVSGYAVIGIIIFMMTFSIGIILYFYLSRWNVRYKYSYDEREPEDVNSLFNRHLTKNIIEKYGSGASEFFNEIEEKKDATKEKLFVNDIEEIKSKFLSQFTYDIKYTKAFEDLYSLEQKVKNQITRLIGNSNLNLILGTLTTLIGIVILGISIFQENSFTTSLDLLSHYIPRISTVILIEIFAFFFLNLYRKNLDEIKYFHNELSNLSFKISSLKSALILENKESASKIIHEFSKVERNFILKKDQTTEKLEIEKLGSQNTSNILEKFLTIISTIKK